VNNTHHSLSGPSSAGAIDTAALWSELQVAAQELGFSQIGVTGVDLSEAEPGLQDWLAAGFHGSMNYMASHGLKRARPAELVPGTLSVITVQMDYLPGNLPELSAESEGWALNRPSEGVVSVYARGRDYHKVMRSRLQKLQHRMAELIGPFGHRVFTDSAPVMEAELAVRSGQGWRGKNTLVLQREAGSFFFLGELFVDLALPSTEAITAHCGSCTACIDLCPTQAIVAPYQLDARRCISYLTIEHAGEIPHELRPLIGNRIYGCDDCQWACPWNKYAKRSTLPDFDAREPLKAPQLQDLLQWDEATFLNMTEGSAIRRIGHARWIRNVALAAGNALRGPEKISTEDAAALVNALVPWLSHPDPVVQEQVTWSLAYRT
jgi:epoxyqueuosine reductase